MAGSERSSSDETFVNSQESNEEKTLEFSEDEEALVIRMYNLIGKRWSLIAGRIPGRTAEEIEKYWNSRDIRQLNETTRNLSRSLHVIDQVSLL